MRKKLCFAVIVAFVLFSSSAFADQVVGTGGGWQSWTVGGITWQNGSPYWNGNSSDYGASGNIGNYLTNTGVFAGGTGPGVAYEYWGMSDGTADAFGFEWLFGSSTAALQLEVAGYASQNIFGYEDINGTRHQLFGGGATAGATAIFTPTMNYVFYLTSPDGTFTTDMYYNDAYQHFALFRESDGVYWLGMEDLRTGSDYDYNDMVVRISQVPVPEPTTMLLLGLGLVGLAGMSRRFKR